MFGTSQICCSPSRDECKGEIIRHHCSYHTEQLSPYYRLANNMNIMHILELNKYALKVCNFEQLQDYISILYNAYKARSKYRKLAFSPDNWDSSKDYILQRIVETICTLDKLIYDYELFNEDTFTIKRESYTITYNILRSEAYWKNRSNIISSWSSFQNDTYYRLKALMDKYEFANRDNFVILMMNVYDVYRSDVHLSFPITPKLPHEIRNPCELIAKISRSMNKNNLFQIDATIGNATQLESINYLLSRITYIGGVEYIDISFNDACIMWKV